MCALHSSSALVANVFDYWTDRDTGPLVEALGVPALVGPPEFEVKLPSGLPGTPPHLDVVLSHVDGSVTAIESKFTEWMSPKRSSGSSFSTSYFPDGRGIWQGRALPGCDSLASRLRHRSESFVLLDAAQLLKHILGLTKAGSGRFTLIYLYVDTTGQAGLQHREEIERFTRLAALGPHFRALTYEEMFRRLCRTAGHGHSSYIDYLGTRYFPDEPRNEEASE